MSELEKGVDTRLSYSSARLIQGCEQKYVYYKVNKVKKDSDATDNTSAFAIGSSFHKVLEDYQHEKLLKYSIAERNKLIRSKLEYCVQAEWLDESDMALVHGMLIIYLRLRKREGYKTIYCEYAIDDPTVIGYIDLIEQDPNGGWWISDMKTAKSFWSTIVARLPQDRQLNLYASYAKDIAKKFGLKMKDFKGCRYLVTTKSSIKAKPGEDYYDLVGRFVKSKAVKSYAIRVPKSKLSAAAIRQEHMELHQKSIDLREGMTPTKNFGYCESYFKPCEYWSQCHGKEFTQLRDNLDVEVEV